MRSNGCECFWQSMSFKIIYSVCLNNVAFMFIFMLSKPVNQVAAQAHRYIYFTPWTANSFTGRQYCLFHRGSIPTHECADNLPVTTEPIIPLMLRVQIEAVHNSAAGHYGVDYTRRVLLGKGMSDDRLRRYVAKFVYKCPVCQLRSALNRQFKTHRYTTTSYSPMGGLNIDTIGRVSRESAENCYILVVIDCFTRSVELYPVSDTSALPCAPGLFISYVCRYGTVFNDHSPIVEHNLRIALSTSYCFFCRLNTNWVKLTPKSPMLSSLRANR